MNKIVIFQITFATDFFPRGGGKWRSCDKRAARKSLLLPPPCIGPPFFTNEIRQRFANAKISRPPDFLEEDATRGAGDDSVYRANVTTCLELVTRVNNFG